MDAGFDENKAEFGIFVLSVTLEMLANSDGLSLINRLPLCWANRERLKATFLINMYRSSGISGARPVI